MKTIYLKVFKNGNVASSVAYFLSSSEIFWPPHVGLGLLSQESHQLFLDSTAFSLGMVMPRVFEGPCSPKIIA